MLRFMMGRVTEIYKKLEEDFGETVLCSPKFDLQTVLAVSPLLIAAFAGVRGVPLTPKANHVRTPHTAAFTRDETKKLWNNGVPSSRLDIL
ncbi:hypothetical protein GBA52_005005 [Prunus armeniaca]|nr:hypothetical protein GBA52_005005 [Prunus armeniaca]